MSTTITGTFATRRQAEMTTERLVQEYGIDRAAITVTAAGAANTAGVTRAGSDTEAGAPSEGPRNDAALAGAVLVSVNLAAGAAANDVHAAFAEFSASTIDRRQH